MKRRDKKVVHALLDGELDAYAEGQLRQRAADDPVLRAGLARLEATHELLKDLRSVDGGPRPFLVPTKSPARSWGWLWFALPAAAAVVAGWAWWSSRLPVEIDAPGVPVELAYTAPEATEVRVAGDFNGWQPEPLTREGDRWAARLRLPPGRYAYMYVVDGRWTADPEAHSFRDDEFGRQNAVLHL